MGESYKFVWAKTPHKIWNDEDFDNADFHQMSVGRYDPSSEATSIQSILLDPINDSDGRPPGLLSIVVDVLEYEIIFSFRFSGLARVPLQLEKNYNPRLRVDKRGIITFGAVLDDKGHPFIKLEFCYFDKVDKRMNMMELVAKRVDDVDPSEYELSKNEKLRLGFPIPEDSQIPKIKMPETTSSSEISVMVENLNQWTMGTARQVKLVESLKSNLDQELSLAKYFLKQAADLADDEPTSPGARNSKRKRIMS